MSRADANSVHSLHNRTIASGLFESGRPVLLFPPSPPQQADRVTVLTVAGETGVPRPSAEQLKRYQQSNGIAAESQTVEFDGGSPGAAILATAKSLSCELPIKGAYTQHRLRQMILGGATRHVLANATLPVIPSRSNATRKAYCPKRFYRRRHKIENFFCRIKDRRRIATRNDKLARNFQATTTFVGALYWIK